MSGYFNSGLDFAMRESADEIKSYIDKIGTKPEEYDSVITYSESTILHLKMCHNALVLSSILFHRVDWLIGGDDGEETFHERFKEDLEKAELIPVDVV